MSFFQRISDKRKQSKNQPSKQERYSTRENLVSQSIKLCCELIDFRRRKKRKKNFPFLFETVWDQWIKNSPTTKTKDKGVDTEKGRKEERNGTSLQEKRKDFARKEPNSEQKSIQQQKKAIKTCRNQRDWSMTDLLKFSLFFLKKKKKKN
jgi:hypothetical protein